MAQYCRYCQNFVTGNGNYCEVRKIEPSDSYAKSPNRCRDFELNPMDAYGENPNEYRPREKREKVEEQIRMELGE